MISLTDYILWKEIIEGQSTRGIPRQEPTDDGKRRKHKINPQQLPNEADPERDHKRVNKDW
ncbi:hypothetical protein ES703_54404 [subsurface metagenome]